jgi:hypothetical protein
MRLNLLLMVASFLLFPTRLMAEAIRDSDAERAAVIFYGGALLLNSVMIAAITRAIAGRRELLRPEISDAEVEALVSRTNPDIGAFVSGTVLAIFLPYVAAVGYLAAAVGLVLRAQGDRPAKR